MGLVWVASTFSRAIRWRLWGQRKCRRLALVCCRVHERHPHADHCEVEHSFSGSARRLHVIASVMFSLEGCPIIFFGWAHLFQRGALARPLYRLPCCSHPVFSPIQCAQLCIPSPVYWAVSHDTHGSCDDLLSSRTLPPPFLRGGVWCPIGVRVRQGLVLQGQRPNLH